MATAKQLVRSLRVRHGLSQAQLARRASCPTSTIGRIETNKLDPTLTTLQRLFAACGEQFPGDQISDFPSLATLAARTPSIDEADWTALRGLVDWVATHPDMVEDIVREPAPQRDPVVANLFAAIAEKIADDSHIPRPEWASSVPPLTTEWRPAGTPRMREREATGAPRQFAKRNLLLSAENLWRNTKVS